MVAKIRSGGVMRNGGLGLGFLFGFLFFILTVVVAVWVVMKSSLVDYN